MKRLKPFSYAEPTGMEEAVQILFAEGPSAFPLAGGTDLLVRMKKGELSPSTLVNLKRIPDLQGIHPEDGKGITIGALSSIASLEFSSFLQRNHPALVDAARTLGSPSIRNLGTVGGNIGRASPASDLAPALLALGACISIWGPQGKRAVGMDEIFAGPGKTILLPGEVLVSFFLPEAVPGTRSAFAKIGRRESMDCALASVAVFLRQELGSEKAASVRIALGAVAPTPLRAKKAEEFLLASPLTAKRIGEASRIASEESAPISDLRCSASYRKEMVAVLVRRTLLQLLRSPEPNA